MKLTLHLGYAKCGSSHIQSYMSQRDAEYRRLGLVNIDPRSQMLRDAWAVAVAQGKVKPQDFIERCESIKGDIDTPHFFYSDEYLLDIIDTKYGMEFHEFLAVSFSAVNLIVYVRRQDLFLESAYQEWGHKLGVSIQEYAAINDKVTPDNSAFFHKLKKLEDAYLSASIYIKPLKTSALVGGDLLNDFCDALRLPFLRKEHAIASGNVGLNLALVDTLSNIDSIFTDHNDRSVREIFDRYVTQKDLLYSKDIDLFTIEERCELLKLYEQQNRWLHGKYFNELDFDEIYTVNATGEDIGITNVAPLMKKITMLEQVVSIQMNMIVTLIRQTGASK